MTDDTIKSLRQDTRDLFYHGYHNYLANAFPEDELKPISCRPQTRNRDNPADIGLNDVLGNYSLTLIDSLSTLAILASGEGDGKDGYHALQDFQLGIEALIDLYGDGRNGSCGSRACGFDLDSKVQVFETNIRGVGGLLSAHLFAIGELPIRGYEPTWTDLPDGIRGIVWPGGFFYTSQLLDLAHDLATRLLPAFNTASSLPYPRVNLRHGIPFYQDAEDGVCRLDGTSTNPREITETCSAGAGSLVLEFTVLSRLTGDEKFERLAKEAFWAVWNRRSVIGLIGAGLDAESGQWTMPPLAGIGAGVDSFFEYALKSHILLSSSMRESESAAFLGVWKDAHTAIKHHIRRSKLTEKHPYYGQSDLTTGAPRFSWIDNLSAYYPGLLTLGGELDEAVEAHLLYSALWTRYSALPERWHAPGNGPMAGGGIIDPNFKHWAGRPEFIESTYYLYQATKDPWFLHVGEMVLRDVRRRCWTPCGWTALNDVVSGEQRDRMESFFLGETAKYLFLLFSAAEGGHVLDRVDANWVFSTEGHPLVIPNGTARGGWEARADATRERREEIVSAPAAQAQTCPAPPPPLPLAVSNVANRPDFFHAAALAQLHLVPVNPARASPLLAASSGSPGISYTDVRSPTNYTYYPWTLPQSLIPLEGMSSPIANPVISTLTFPNLSLKDGQDDTSEGKPIIPFGALQKVLDGILINSLSNVRLNMVQIPRQSHATRNAVALNQGPKGPIAEYRIQSIANWALGRDEKVLISTEAMKAISPTDPHFTRVKDLERVDLVLDIPTSASDSANRMENVLDVGLDNNNKTVEGLWEDLEGLLRGFLSGTGLEMQDHHDEGKKHIPPSRDEKPPTNHPALTRRLIPAILPTGIGAAPLPASMDTTDPIPLALGALPFQSIYFLDSTLCHQILPASIAKTYSILVIKRGGCSFNQKLSNIPSFAPELGKSLELVIVVSTNLHDDVSVEGAEGQETYLIRPLLDEVQRTPNGLERRFPIAMVMVDGGGEVVEALRRIAGQSGGWDGRGRFVEVDGVGPGGSGSAGRRGGGLAVKRRFWFESNGVPIGNLVVL